MVGVVRRWGSKSLPASYTVEAAWVMAVVLFTIMMLINRAFLLQAETCGQFRLHEQIERERHEIANIEEGELTRSSGGNGWELEITAPVFRPEDSLRMWSLAEDLT